MRIVVHICNSYALEKFVYSVPDSEEQSDIRDIRLPHESFNLISDQVISLSISNKGICLNEELSNVYIIFLNRLETCNSTISEDAELRLITVNKEELKMFIFFGQEPMRFYRVNGSHVISLGSGLNNTISCPEEECISENHLLLKQDDDGSRLNVKGKEGCYLNNRFISRMEAAFVEYGDVITAGPISLLWLNDHIGIQRLNISKGKGGVKSLCLVRLERTERPEDASPDSDKDREFHPLPRNIVCTDDGDIELDPPPPKKEIRKQPAILTIGPALTMAVPMCLGCGMYIITAARNGQHGTSAYMYTGLITAVASALIGCMWAVINIRNSRRAEAEEEALRIYSYREYIERSNRIILDKFRYNTNALLRNAPTVREMFAVPEQPRIWNRAGGDKDAFTYRIGKGQQPFNVQIKVPKEKFTTVPDELAGLPEILKKRYSSLCDVPVCVDLGKNRLLGFIADEPEDITQLFINISLQIAGITEPYLVKMIFLFSENVIKEQAVECMHWLPQTQGDDEHYVGTDAERIDEILCSMDRIMKHEGKEALRFVILTDDHRKIPASLAAKDNVSICIFARNFSDLPVGCSAVIQNNASFRGLLNMDEERTRKEVRFDCVQPEELDKYVRILAGLRYGRDAKHSPIPWKVTLPELFKTDFFTVGMIGQYWKRNDTLNSLRAPVGMAEDRRTVYLDIHEKVHGPHGLIAGMTGSGKSEMLQTLILSLAIRYPPTQIGFFLIDYKGGGMANLFEGLPHLMGSISNLSGNIIHRAMVSIRSENERRQRVFQLNGVNSIGDYGRLYSSGRVDEPLPHILIIIDEFAELKRNEPDFMKELISVAQVGRSLGVHLILATQKPSGTVDDNIFSNSRFRICLRVQDKQDSMDMLHRSEAAYISNPGRAYLQVGNDELFESFQAGYTMETYEEHCDRDPSAYLLDKYRRKHEVLFKSSNNGNDEGSSVKITHFTRIMQLLNECNEVSGLPEISRLWLPPLKDIIVIPDRERQAGPDDKDRRDFKINVGRYDAPYEQKQDDLILDLIETGHMVICGSALSGKSTFLQTFIYEHIAGKTPDELNIYIVDYSNGILSCFKDSNLVGGYITGENDDKLKNLFCMISEMIKKRRSDFDGVGYAQRLQYGDVNEPAVMLIIDNYGAFREKTELKYDKDMQEIIKSGESYGIYAILTGASIGSSDIPARLFENCRTGICLRLNDKYQYSECLREIRLPILPDEGIAGRGLARVDSKILEFQTGLCCEGNDVERSRWIKSRMKEINACHKDSAAEAVPYIPEDPCVEDLDRCIESQRKYEGIPFGYDLSSGRPWCIPYKKIRIVLVAGRAQSGKTNACKVVGHYAQMCGIKVVTVRDLKGICEYMKKKNLPGEPDELVICDDLSEVLENFYMDGYDRSAEQEIVEAMRNTEGKGLFFTLDSSRHSSLAGRRIYEQIRSACLGIYLAGGLDKQNVFDFSYMNYSEQCMVKPPGRGTVMRSRSTECNGDIIIPLAETG